MPSEGNRRHPSGHAPSAGQPSRAMRITRGQSPQVLDIERIDALDVEERAREPNLLLIRELAVGVDAVGDHDPREAMILDSASGFRPA